MEIEYNILNIKVITEIPQFIQNNFSGFVFCVFILF